MGIGNERRRLVMKPSSKRWIGLLILPGVFLGVGLALNHGSVNAATSAFSPITPGQVKLQFYNGDTQAATNFILLNIRVINPGTTPLYLDKMNIQYYYTINGETDQNFVCDYATVGSMNVSGSFVKMPTPKVGADYYLEIRFNNDAGILAPSDNIIVQARIAKSNGAQYTQTDDYSFNPKSNTFVDWARITGSAVFNWGMEPKN
jgi:hypothetical protein